MKVINVKVINFDDEENGSQYIISPFPEDMHQQSFLTTEAFCNYFYQHHSDLCVEGANFQGTFTISDFPSTTHGGELILKCFGANLFQLDFYSTNTEPHHWYTMYLGTLQFPWTGSIQRIEMGTPVAYDYQNGRIYQYRGETTSDFINGYFYKAVPNPLGSGYIWQQINVQPTTGNEVLKVTFTNTENNTITSDKTIQEIVDAIIAKTPVMGFYESQIYGLGTFTVSAAKSSGVGVIFTSSHDGSIGMITGEVYENTDNWRYEEKNSFTGATPTGNGVSGFVPTPMMGDDTKFLCGDGTWKTVSLNIAGTNANEIPIFDSNGNIISSGKTINQLMQDIISAINNT